MLDSPRLVLEKIASLHFGTTKNNNPTKNNKKNQPNNNTDSRMIHMTCNNNFLFFKHCCDISWKADRVVVTSVVGMSVCGLLSIVYNAKGGLSCSEVVVVCCVFICQAGNDVVK